MNAVEPHRPQPPQPPHPPQAPESEDLFDYALIRHWTGYVLRSVKRHLLLACGVFVLVVAGTAFVAWGIPRTYHTETKILAERNQVIATLGNPDRRMPWDADAPTRAASELVLSRENLEALIRQTNLLQRWDDTRAPFLRAKDWLMEKVRGQLSEEDRIDALVGVLEKKLSVYTDEGSVTIGIDWPDAQMAFLLVDGARQNLLESRHAKEVSTIAEAISILEAHAEEVRESLINISDELKKDDPSPEKGSAQPRRVQRRDPGTDSELAQLEVMLAAKRKAIEDLESFRRRRLAELQAQLVEQKATYADQHPVVVNTINSIESLSRPSAQIVSLKREAEDLQSDIDRRRAKKKEDDQREAQKALTADVPAGAPAHDDPAREGDALKSASTFGTTPTDLDLLKMKQGFERGKYDDLLARIDAARIELDASRAAFKYRYSVVKPPQVSRKPVKPNVPMLLVAGIIAALALAVMATAAYDLRGGRVLEAWQIERSLDVPLLAELRQS